MRITVQRDVLAEAVAWVARSLPNRPSVPILAGLLIQATDAGVVISSFDYETSAKITLAAEVSDEGTALVSGKLLADIARSLPNRPVELTADELKMELKCGSIHFSLQTLPVTEYPEIPEMPSVTGVLESQAFAAGVNQVVVAAGRDELLPVFTGVRVEIDGNNVSLLATDRYRMALKELQWTGQSGAVAAALIPAKVLAETAKSMTGSDTISLALSTAEAGDGLVGFSSESPSENRQITTRLLDGSFPKVRHLMSVEPTVSARFATDEIIAAAKRVALVAERNMPVRMLISEDEATLDAATGDQAQAAESLNVQITKHTAGDLEITAAGFNPHYLIDALNSFTTPYVNFDFTAPGKPCLIMGAKDAESEVEDDYRHVIMLMRLPN